MTAATVERLTINLRADQFVSGLSVRHELAAAGGQFGSGEPLAIRAIEPAAGGHLEFEFADGSRVRFAPDEQLTMVCAETVHPNWCAECNVDSDGSVYHGSPYRCVEFVPTFREGEGRTRTVEVWVAVHRLDDPDGTQGPTTITLMYGSGIQVDGEDLTAAAARDVARLLLDAADLADGGAS